MDVRTVLDRITREVARVTEHDRALAARAVESALRSFKRRDLHFNRATGTLDVTAGTASYASESVWTRTDTDLMPRDALKILKVWPSGYPEQSLSPTSRDRYRDFPGDATGDPILRLFENGTLYLWPTPSEDVTLDFDYIQDLGDLNVGLTSDGKLQIYVNGEIVSEEYTNDWFTLGQDLIVYDAEYRLWMGPYKDAENAAMARELRQQALRDVEGLSSGEGAIPDVTPWGY